MSAATATYRALVSQLDPPKWPPRGDGASGTDEDREERLRGVAESVGLHLSSIELAVEEIPVVDPVLLPIATLLDDGSALVVHAVGRTRVEVSAIDPRGTVEGSTITPERLRRMLDTPEGVARRWYGAALLRPLDTLQNHDASAPVAAWRRVMGFARAYRRYFWVVVVYAITVGMLTLALPVAVQVLINTVAFGTLLQPLVVLVLLLALALVASAVLELLKTTAIEMLSRRVFVEVASDLASRLPLVKDASAFGHSRSVLVHRFFEAVSMEKSIAALLFGGLSAVLQIIVGTVLLAAYHPTLLLFAAGLWGGLLFVVFVLGRGGLRTSLEESEAKYTLAEWLDHVATQRVLFGSSVGGELARERAERLTRQWYQARSAHFRVVLRQLGGLLGTQVLASSLLLLFGGWLVIEEQLTLGQLVAAELVMSATVASLATLGKQLPKIYDLATSLEKVGRVVDLELDPTDLERAPNDGGGLAIGLEDTQATESTPAVREEVAPGEKVAVVGSSPTVTSALLEVIAGFRVPHAGTVAIGGVELRELSAPSVRDRVVLVRDCEILPGTVADNVLAGGPGDTRAAREALSRVGLSATVRRLPRGIMTELGPLGAPLTAGEARLLTIARAVAREPGIIVVDRLLDQLDLEGRRAVLDVLFAEDAPWTVICATSDPEVAARCGRRIEIGTSSSVRRLVS